MNVNDRIRQWRAKDNRRQSMPGEHVLAAGAGAALIVAALFAPSPARATFRALLGAALLLRAATGRDGVPALTGAPVDSAREPWLFPTSARHGTPKKADPAA